MLKWSTPTSKAKRCRLDCGKSFFIIENPLRNGNSYQLEYRDTNGLRKWIRMDKSRIQERDAAYEEHLKLRIQLAEAGNTEHDTTVSTFSDGIALYLADKKADNLRCFDVIEKMMWNRLDPYFGALRLKEISLQTVKKYRDYRRKTVEDATVKIEVGYLREYFNLMIDLGHCVVNPINVKKLRLQTKEREVYMRAEEEAVIWPLLKKYPPMEDLATFLYGTTMRPGNIVNLLWDRVRWTENEAFVPKEEHKNKKKDGHYLLDLKVQKMLKRREKANNENGCFPYIFCRYEYGQPKRITARWIQRMWEKIMEEAGIETGLHFYDLKHTRLSRIAAATKASVFELKRISNHSSTTSLEKYVKGDALKEAALELLEKTNQVWSKNGE